MKTKLSLLIASGLAISSLTFGAPDNKGFSKADSDGNGSISKAEFVAARIAGAKKNAEKNGKEFDASKAEGRFGKLFSSSDANSDGKLDATEFAAAAAPQGKKK